MPSLTVTCYGMLIYIHVLFLSEEKWRMSASGKEVMCGKGMREWGEGETVVVIYERIKMNKNE